MRILLLAFLFSVPVLVLGSGVIPIVPCDGATPGILGKACGACELVKLGNNIIKFLVTILAFGGAVMFAYGGMLMAMSAGDMGKVEKGKGIMTNVVIGLVILLSGWLIVDTVMKVLVNQSTTSGIGPWHTIQCVPTPQPTATTPTPAPAPIPAPATTTPVQPATTTACTIPPLTPVTDSLAQQMEGGQTVLFNNTTLQACVTKFTGKVGGTVTSAYRPPAYQTHLWEIRDRWCTQGLQSNTSSLCSTLKTSVSGEVQKHFGGNWSCGAVGRTSTHSSGVGVDITGISHGSAAVQQAARESCLVWRNYPNDAVHYDLVSGCTCQ